MHITWLGQTCVKLQTKNNVDEDITILIDAYKPETGDFPRSFTPNIAIYSRGDEGAATLSQNPFIINTMGEFEIKDAMVYSLAGPEGKLIFKINAEGLNIVHLGKLTKKIENGNLEKIGSPDILFIPAGGEKEYLDVEAAAQMITNLEPRIIIPIGYKCDTDPNIGSLSDFIKEIGIKPDITDKKIIIKKKDLPQEETKLIVLEKN